MLFISVMDDFSIPTVTSNEYNVHPSKLNRIAPGKRPLSSMTPAIFVDQHGKVRLSLGGSGGIQITSATAYVALRTIMLGDGIKEAIDAPRIHTHLNPNVVSYEKEFNTDDLIAMRTNKGHKIQEISGRGSIIMAVEQHDGKLYANSDFRKQGDVDGF